MNRFSAGLLALVAVCLGTISGCDYSGHRPDEELDLGPVSLADRGATQGASRDASRTTLRDTEERTAILDSSMTLIQRAAIKPGGDNFRLAVQKLNHYFDGTSLSNYKLPPPAREFLLTQLPARMVAELENRNWSLRDARHLEDCMMYYGIATRVAGTGEELDKVRRLFGWVVRQILLVPPGLLGSRQLPQVYARPYDVLLRGMATETDGFWAERSWLFMSLCRQLGLDAGLVCYSRSHTLERSIPRYMVATEYEADLMHMRRQQRPPILWICAVRIGEKLYLFDARLGLEIPGPGGKGVATLDDVVADPAILEQMNLPGESPYGTSRASLVGSPTRIGIYIDSSQGYFSPKMKLLQSELGGKYRTILYRDPAEERDAFARAFGKHFGGMTLWGLPLEVETQLFSNPSFVASVQASLFLFRPEFPLVYCRVKQLRGEFEEAVQDFVKLRFAENATLVTDNKRTIPKDIQRGLDVYATYYLGLMHLENGKLDQAEMMFRQILKMVPEPAPNQPYYHMFRWGANTNLARLLDARRQRAKALPYYLAPNPTSEWIGNLLRARDIVWDNPLLQ